MADFFKIVSIQPQLGQGQGSGADVEQPQNQIFPVNGGQGRGPDIDFLVVDPDVEAAVLGDAGVGDVHVGQHLEPGDNPRQDGAGRGRNFVELAVDSQPDLGAVFFRADMDIAGPALYRLAEDGVDQADHRGGAGHVLGRPDHLGFRLLAADLDILVHVVEHIADRRVHPVNAV